MKKGFFLVAFMILFSIGGIVGYAQEARLSSIQLDAGYISFHDMRSGGAALHFAHRFQSHQSLTIEVQITYSGADKGYFTVEGGIRYYFKGAGDRLKPFLGVTSGIISEGSGWSGIVLHVSFGVDIILNEKWFIPITASAGIHAASGPHSLSAGIGARF